MATDQNVDFGSLFLLSILNVFPYFYEISVKMSVIILAIISTSGRAPQSCNSRFYINEFIFFFIGR
jgi:hypothetical protein